MHVGGLVESVVVDAEGDRWVACGGDVHHIRPDGAPPETSILELARSVVEGEQLLIRVRGHERFRSLGRARSFLVQICIDDDPWKDYGLPGDEPIAIREASGL